MLFDFKGRKVRFGEEIYDLDHDGYLSPVEESLMWEHIREMNEEPNRVSAGFDDDDDDIFEDFDE